MDDTYKRETVRTYDAYPEAFDCLFGDYFVAYVQPFADEFASLLPSGARVLDLGSGPGSHAAYFASRGLDVLCVDLSVEMVAACRAKGLRAEQMDMESLTVPERSFDGIWAYTSLLHLPRARVPAVISTIASLLVPRGILGIALKAGEGEGFETHTKYPGTKRWFSYYTNEEARALFADRFELLSASSSSVKEKYVFLHYLFRAR